MIDPRVVRLGIQVGDNIQFYENLSIYAKGTKFTSPNQGQCTITILNLNRTTREYLERVANPFNNSGQRTSVILEVGRKSYGTTVLYTGDIFRVYPTSKPDLGLELVCITGYFDKGRLVSRSGQELASLSSIASGVATDNNLGLSFEIDDRNIANYSFTGSPSAQIVKLSELTGSDVYVDNSIIYVKPFAMPKTGATTRVINKNTGMIGVPKGTENGVKVTMLFDPVTQLGSRLELTSEINPVLDGEYVIYKLEFDITSRETPFYLHAEALRLQ